MDRLCGSLAVALGLGCVAGCAPERAEQPSAAASGLDQGALTETPGSSIAVGSRRLKSAREPLAPGAVAAPYFTEAAAEWGLTHSYRNGASGKLLMLEPTGG